MLLLSSEHRRRRHRRTNSEPTLAVDEEPEIFVGVVLLELLHGDLLLVRVGDGLGIGLGHFDE